MPTVKELKLRCKNKGIKRYSKLNKKGLIKILRGGNPKSCHEFDDDCNKCYKTKTSKGYRCDFVIHDINLSKCIKRKNVKKHPDYNKSTTCQLPVFNLRKDNVKIPKIDAKQLETGLQRYLKVKGKINLKINNKKVDNDFLKKENFNLSNKLYTVIKTLIDPGFHNESSISTFKHPEFTKYIFKNNKKIDYIMCNVDIDKINISINYDKDKKKYNLIVSQYLTGKLSCMKNGNLYARPIKNIIIEIKWNSLSNLIDINYISKKKVDII